MEPHIRLHTHQEKPTIKNRRILLRIKLFQLRQKEGSAMGSPSSPILANIVMNYVIDKVLSTIDFNIPFIKLYVDHTFMSCPAN